MCKVFGPIFHLNRMKNFHISGIANLFFTSLKKIAKTYCSVALDRHLFRVLAFSEAPFGPRWPSTYTNSERWTLNFDETILHVVQQKRLYALSLASSHCIPLYPIVLPLSTLKVRWNRSLNIYLSIYIFFAHAGEARIQNFARGCLGKLNHVKLTLKIVKNRFRIQWDHQLQ